MAILFELKQANDKKQQPYSYISVVDTVTNTEVTRVYLKNEQQTIIRLLNSVSSK